MKLVTIKLDENSQILIKSLWIIEESKGIDISVKSFPNGYPYISVISGALFRVVDHRHQCLETKSFLSGAATLPFDLHMPLVKRSLTIQLRPYAIPYLLGIPASEFAGARIPVGSFSKYLSDRFESLIDSDKSSESVLHEVVYLLKEYAKDLVVDKRILSALDEILRSKGNASIDLINSKINLSQRRLQQLFKQHIGLSAKSYCKIVRVQHHTFELLNGKSLDTIVPDGYYDQSHFIHELKQQTQMSPTTFKAYINREEHKAAYYFSNLFCR